MDITISPHKLCGTVCAIPSKSQAHRVLICAAFADRATKIICPETNKDIEATVKCLNAINAAISRTSDGYFVIPCSSIPKTAVLDCGESGSTLRFLLPIAGALGIDATFLLSGRLPSRPLSPLWEEMERMGCILSRPAETAVRCQGQLIPGAYSIDGGTSSQFITGLLFALSLLSEKSTLAVTGKIESAPYIDMTIDALRSFGISSTGTLGGEKLVSPGTIQIEGDWSNGAFFLAAEKLGNQITVTNLISNSVQGDRAAADWFEKLSSFCTVCAANIPDLIPILAVVASVNHGAVFTDIQRLRLKESDRVESTIHMLRSLGGKAEADENSLTVYPSSLVGGTVDSYNDHRIAMAAAIASTVCSSPVTILGAQAVSKSYPIFWEEFSRLGGVI